MPIKIAAQFHSNGTDNNVHVELVDDVMKRPADMSLEEFKKRFKPSLDCLLRYMYDCFCEIEKNVRN